MTLKEFFEQEWKVTNIGIDGTRVEITNKDHTKKLWVKFESFVLLAHKLYLQYEDADVEMIFD